ncbi:acyl-CoA dehydrogenase [Tersicoccus solisilvae]|uniref:Acyl-CoA dehydrogenase n=1 Tax=Tersicoccus solisilvae TaxID=1882339 RepID=A0ABQ1NI41_9MICC|nr:acyl-CoA dehydrogenase [Tersicoccus solisilvae]GGC77789.1 acyl-CoA dehydrogenase [Tersicoccus solisilvae]
MSRELTGPTVTPGSDLRLRAGIGPGRPAGRAAALIADAFAAGTGIGTAGALELARRLGTELPGPGRGRTAELWEALAEVAARDLGAARTVEPHLDALAILDQLPDADRDRVAAVGAGPDSTWGVFAAEGQGLRLEAHGARGGPTQLLTGGKPWCSLAGSLTHAVVTAHPATAGVPADGQATGDARRAFAVDLRHPGVTVADAAWVGLGLPTVPSGPVEFASVPAVPVGEPGWYLRRPGFAWGGIGVAACWYGGAVGVARLLATQARRRGDGLDQIGLMLLGQVDVALVAARTALADAAERVDAGGATGSAGALLALRVRAVVADAAETVLRAVGHGTGPAPLAFDAEHAHRVADLQLYLRQEHAERDRAALGRSLLTRLADDEELPW